VRCAGKSLELAARGSAEDRCSGESDPTESPDILTIPPGELLLWGWPELLAFVPIPRRTLEQELSAGKFPKPVKRVGRRPFWRPGDVRQWAEGGKP
jgi:predicted DNA-binding transcriptional regulator AlpA